MTLRCSRTTPPWEWTRAFGRPVVPEEYSTHSGWAKGTGSKLSVARSEATSLHSVASTPTGKSDSSTEGVACARGPAPGWAKYGTVACGRRPASGWAKYGTVACGRGPAPGWAKYETVVCARRPASGWAKYG